MHEASLVAAMCTEIETLARKEAAQKVGFILVRVGELSGVEREAFIFAFEAYKKNHPLFERASLKIEIIPARRFCLQCQSEFAGKPPCPQCGSLQTYPLSGNELELTRVELILED